MAIEQDKLMQEIIQHQIVNHLCLDESVCLIELAQRHLGPWIGKFAFGPH
jgi:hypothetical protein